MDADGPRKYFHRTIVAQAHIKYEEVYLHEYANPNEAYRQLFQYIQFYNFVRPHQSLEYRTPAQVYDVQSLWYTRLIRLSRWKPYELI